MSQVSQAKSFGKRVKKKFLNVKLTQKNIDILSIIKKSFYSYY